MILVHKGCFNINPFQLVMWQLKGKSRSLVFGDSFPIITIRPTNSRGLMCATLSEQREAQNSLYDAEGRALGAVQHGLPAPTPPLSIAGPIKLGIPEGFTAKPDGGGRYLVSRPAPTVRYVCEKGHERQTMPNNRNSRVHILPCQLCDLRSHLAHIRIIENGGVP